MTLKTATVLSICLGAGAILARLLLSRVSGQSLVEIMSVMLLVAAVFMVSPFLVYFGLRLLDSK